MQRFTGIAQYIEKKNHDCYLYMQDGQNNMRGSILYNLFNQV